MKPFTITFRKGDRVVRKGTKTIGTVTHVGPKSLLCRVRFDHAKVPEDCSRLTWGGVACFASQLEKIEAPVLSKAGQ